MPDLYTLIAGEGAVEDACICDPSPGQAATPPGLSQVL